MDYLLNHKISNGNLVFDGARKVKLIGVGWISGLKNKYVGGSGALSALKKPDKLNLFTCAPCILFSNAGRPPWVAAVGRHLGWQNMIMLILLMIIMLRNFG